MEENLKEIGDNLRNKECPDLYHNILQIQDTLDVLSGLRNYAMSFINLVGVEFYRHHEVEYYADRLCITTNYLNKISHSSLGVSAREYIQGRIINEAKNLLDITGMNVSEISNTLGFNTTNYFIRFFKKHTGVTPGEYRNKAQ